MLYAFSFYCLISIQEEQKDSSIIIMSSAHEMSSAAMKRTNYELEMVELSKEDMNATPIELTQSNENKNTLVYRFKQQLISAWRPVPSLSTSIILFVILTIFFVALGIVIFVFTYKEFEVEVRYDSECSGSTCDISFEIQEQINPPIYFYYGLTNFNQNQRFYAISKSEAQIQDGANIDLEIARSRCGSKTTNEQMKWTTAVDGTTLGPTDVAFPCGLIAYSFFNDTFSLKRSNDSSSIYLNQSGIAMPYDKQIYKNYDLSVQGIDLQNQHFLVWLRPSVTKSFYKLWGIINTPLLKQNYTITIQNNYNINFSQKWIKLAHANVFGNNNIILPIAYFICGGICLVILIAFLLGKIKERCAQ